MACNKYTAIQAAQKRMSAYVLYFRQVQSLISRVAAQTFQFITSTA